MNLLNFYQNNGFRNVQIDLNFEFQSTSKVNCDMIIAFFQNVMIPRNIKNGQLSCEVYRVSDTTGFVISCFKNKNDASKIWLLGCC